MKKLSIGMYPRGYLEAAFLVLGLGATAPAAKATLDRDFVWESFGEKETLHVKVPTTLETHYSSKTRTYQYANYVLEDDGYEMSGKLAKAFEARATAKGWSDWELLNVVVDFVQSLEYQSEVGEYPKYPVETLLDGGGDCEDTSILLAALLDQLDVDCILLSPPGHMAVGVSVDGLQAKRYNFAGTNYYYVETTGKNWTIGAVPTSYAGSAKAYPLPTKHAAYRAIAAEEEVDEFEEEETSNLMIAFYREGTREIDPATKTALYRFEVHVDADDALLSSIQEVQYRLMTAQGEPDPTKAWMRAYDAETGFSKAWKASGTKPVQVRIYFQDGSLVEMVADFRQIVDD